MDINDFVSLIVNQTATLYERIDGDFVPNNNVQNDKQVENYLNQWCETCADGDQEVFATRLARDGFDQNTIRPILGSVTLKPEISLPNWATIIAECIKLSFRVEDEESQILIRSLRNYVPFEEIFVPFVLVARSILCNKSGSINTLLSTTAKNDLERHLLWQLTIISSQVLELEFSIFKAQHQSSLDRLIRLSSDTYNEDLYQRFMNKFDSGGMMQLLSEYAVLARLIATTIEFWIESVEELIIRLYSDIRTIYDTFNNGENAGIVSNIKTGISDNHNKGRSVYIITFNGGLSVVYKPKNIEVELKYSDIQTWLNTMNAPLHFKPIRIISRDRYGWVEFIQHLPCKDIDEVDRYFSRCGMILCLMYLLEATDCHSENIIAHGEYPQIIDLETMMHPNFQFREDIINPSARSLAEQYMLKSVLRTLLLPHWVIEESGKSRDLSGLGGANRSQASYDGGSNSAVSLNETNIVENKMSNDINLPFLEDESFLAVEKYTEEIVDGFTQIYSFLMKIQPDLLAEDSPINSLRHQIVRFVLRPTSTYSSLLRRSLNPDFLRNGLKRSIEVDALSRIFLQSEDTRSYWPLLKSEHISIERLDIPYFSSSSSETNLYFDGNKVISIFLRSSFIEVISNIAHLSYDNLNIQKQLIQSSFYAYTANEGQNNAQWKFSINDIEQRILEPSDLIDEAYRIVKHLKNCAIYAPDNSITWIALQPHAQAKRYQLRPIGYDLYGGATGIALFLAASTRLFDEPELASLALSALQSVRQAINLSGKRLASSIGIGGFSGLGSVIYVLSCVGDLLQDVGCIDDALIGVSSIREELIAKDNQYDVVAGSAGLLLSLLHLHRHHNSYITSSDCNSILKLAAVCGNHLLRNRATSSKGYRAWTTIDGHLRTGFSHGVSGIAYALLELFKVTNDNRYKEAALEAIAYERSTFSVEENNWPEYETVNDVPSKANYFTQWCYGAPGIGLSRLASLSVNDDLETRLEIDAAISTTLNGNLNLRDHLCCGHLGRVRVILEASRQLNRHDLELISHSQLAYVIDEARKQSDELVLNWKIVHPRHNPGFMQGLAGIGYCLLEMTDTERILPNVLLLQ